LLLAHTRIWAPISQNGLLLEKALLLKQRHDLTSYLAERVKLDRGEWSAAGLAFLMKTAGTLRQRAALVKLYIGHYQADLQFANGSRPRCRCGCRDILADWLSICRRAEVIQLNQKFKVELAQLSIPTEFAVALFSTLMGQDNVFLFRGIWTAQHRNCIETTFRRRSDATVRTWRIAVLLVTKFLTHHALSLHALISSIAGDNSPVSAVDQAQPALGNGDSIYTVPFLITLRHNPSKKIQENPGQKAKLNPRTTPRRSQRGPKSHSLHEYFKVIPPVNPPIDRVKLLPSLGGATLATVNSTDAVTFVTLRPKQRSDIRVFMQPTSSRSVPRPGEF